MDYVPLDTEQNIAVKRDIERRTSNERWTTENVRQKGNSVESIQ